jgi:hypothetical protein
VISGRFEDVIVQKVPGMPVFCEHSFVTWRAPLRPEDADTVGAPVLGERIKPSARAKAKIVVITLKFILMSFLQPARFFITAGNLEQSTASHLYQTFDTLPISLILQDFRLNLIQMM